MHEKRDSVTLTQAPTRNVHWPGWVSPSHAGSLSMQSNLRVGLPSPSGGGTGVTAHSTMQSFEPVPPGTQSLTFEMVPPAEQAARAAIGAVASVRAHSMVAPNATRAYDFMGSSSDPDPVEKWEPWPCRRRCAIEGDGTSGGPGEMRSDRMEQGVI